MPAKSLQVDARGTHIMWLRMIPTGLGMSTRTTFGDQTETAHSLTFALHLAGQDSLKLATGEVFENPRYASIRGNQQKEIYAHLNVRPASDERDPSHTNDMRYFAGSKGDDYSPPSIHFDVSTPASDYSLLLNNIRGGITPSLVTVGLRHNLRDKGSPVKYGYAPDGSMMIWDNAAQQNRRVDVESIEFHYRLIGDADDDDGEGTRPPTVKASIDAASIAIVAKLAELERAFVKPNRLIVTMIIIIACAVLYYARH
jgi:hypothetical protein